MSIEPQRPDSEPTEPSLELDDAHETPDVHYLHAPIMREQVEPRDGREPVPLWLTLFYGFVVFWGGYYLATYNGGFRPDVYDENSLRVGIVADVGKGEPDPEVLGKRLFTVNCAACHQQSGEGVAGQFPPLVDSEWVIGEPAILIRILLHGLQGPLTVRGETYNGNMPAFGEKLDDQQLSLVLTYIRQSWGNQADAITPEWIGQVREIEKDRSTPWSADELQAVKPEPPPETAADEPANADNAGEASADKASADKASADKASVDKASVDKARPTIDLEGE